MKTYKYQAKDENGKNVSGKIQANDAQDLHERLKNENKFLVDYKEEVKVKNIKRIKSDAISEFARNLGELIGAGVSLMRALKIVSEDESIKPKQREIYKDIQRLVRSGMSLSDALLEQGDAFPPLFVNMIKSAETSGNMDQIALQMASYYDKEYRLSQKVKSAMTYPKILCVMIVVVVAVIMGFVIPQFEGLFAQMDELPLATSILLGISNFVATKWYVLIFAGVLIFMFFKVLLGIGQVKLLIDRMEIHLPVIGKLRKVIYTARFARTLSSLYSAGIPIVSCLQIAKNTIGNTYIENQFDKLIADIRSGGNLSDAVDSVDGFTKKLSSSILVGEETGALDTMLSSTATQMEYDSEMALNRMVSFLEPAMIVVMALVVGFIIIAVITPIFGSYQTISDMG